MYPDDLVGIILHASTNPLQIVQADRNLDKREQDPKAPIDGNWNDPVKALLNCSDVIKMMSQGFDWTAALGKAVAADTAALQATLALQAILAASNRSNAASQVARRDFARVDRG